MQTVHICKSETWSGEGFTIKIDDGARQNKYRPVCLDKMGIMNNFVGIAQNFNKSIVGE